jgi:hypothetical protein
VLQFYLSLEQRARERIKRGIVSVDEQKSQLKAGDLGIVVMIHGKHLGYELEIFSAEGRTLDVVTDSRTNTSHHYI